GGAFTFLREIHKEGLAGSLSWVLLVGYVLTNAVYAFTFGQYLGHVVGLGSWFPRVAAVAIVVFFVALNLEGVGEASGVEIFLVWFKLFVLAGLAAYGLSRWNPELLGRGVPDVGPAGALLGAASVFMAYEGFQLLTYDYDDIDRPDVILPRAILSAIVVVIAVYVAIAVATPMLIGADGVVTHQEVALAVAGREAAGGLGLVVVTIAAAFSTGSAINSTIFATARLSHQVAGAGELPAWLDHLNRSHIPDRAVVALGLSAAVLATIGSLSTLVEAASPAFLGTFAVVGWLAFRERAGHRALTGVWDIGCRRSRHGVGCPARFDEPRCPRRASGPRGVRHARTSPHPVACRYRVKLAMAEAGVNVNLVYLATGTRAVIGAADLGRAMTVLG
ncbi:MAG: APC family permease, partial [Acidimicrobiia bacterium]